MKEYIKELLKNCSSLNELNLSNNNYEDILILKMNEEEGSYVTGASKVVFIPKNKDYVVKIPFTGYSEDSFFEDENGDWYDEYKYKEFEGANNGNNDWDYCLRELYIYHKAKAAKVERVFLKTIYEGTINDFPIYSQPKVSNFVEDRYVTCSKEEIESTREKIKKKNFNVFSPTWLFYAFNYYGEDYIFRLLSFIKEEEICDLHCGNLGWVGNKPVIVDYAGFDS